MRDVSNADWVYRVCRTALTAAALAAYACAALPAWAAAEPEPIERPSTLTPLAMRALMLSVTRAGASRTVAVGERGIVLISDDDGKTWRQAPTPVSVTLTSVQFVDAKRGWAAGHAGVILHSSDGGEHWTRQLDGMRAAQLALEEAQALMPAGPDAKATVALSQADGDVTAAPPTSPYRIALSNARRLAAEGADKPLLSLWFSDALHGTAVGAYGLVVHTEDGGVTWHSWTARIGNAHSLHLYAVRQRGDTIWIAGEQGFVARSVDSGKTFGAVSTPYKGSLFALDVGPDDIVIMGGLRGNAMRSTDGGAMFTMFKPGGDASITDVEHTRSGVWMLSAQNGQVYAGNAADGEFRPLIGHPTFPLDAITAADAGTVIGVGFAGARTVAILPGQKNTAQSDARATGAQAGGHQ